MRLTTRELTVCAMLVELALALSYLEGFFPLSLVIPLPGVKLGLANVVTLFALYALGPGQAVLILLGRCFLGAMFAGNINALLFSLLGGGCGTSNDDASVQGKKTFHLRCFHRGSRRTQLRPGGSGSMDAGQHRSALLSAGFAGSLSGNRDFDRRDCGWAVSGTGTYRPPARIQSVRSWEKGPGSLK